MIISRTPLRISFAGGGTDIAAFYKKNAGAVTSTAINKYIYVTINRKFDHRIRVSYSKTENVDHVDELHHGLVREAMKLTGIDSGVEITTIADIPSRGTGLGSSSTLTVGLLNALYAFKGVMRSRQILAKEACKIEIEILGEPIGKQDQYAAAFGGFNAYFFHKDGRVSIEPIRIKEENLIELQNNLVLFHIKKERKTTYILEVQNRKTEEGDPKTLERLHKIKEIGLYTRKVFENGNIDEFGELLHEHWLTKRGLSDRISNSFIDEVYEEARKNGAIGGKIVGAGGGGFLLLYCPKNKAKLVSHMQKMGLSPMWVSFECGGAKIIFYG